VLKTLDEARKKGCELLSPLLTTSTCAMLVPGKESDRDPDQVVGASTSSLDRPVTVQSVLSTCSGFIINEYRCQRSSPNRTKRTGRFKHGNSGIVATIPEANVNWSPGMNRWGILRKDMDSNLSGSSYQPSSQAVFLLATRPGQTARTG